MGHTEFFFIVVLGLWEASEPTKKILARSEKITDRNHYGIICPKFFGHIKSMGKFKILRTQVRCRILRKLRPTIFYSIEK